MSAQGLTGDDAVRERAVDVTRSCIVQAPAGSGKTSLLVRRYLGLLAVVEEPEEIIAITFTRKAAAEMRGRILAALEAAARGETADTPHKADALQAAAAVLARDRARGWALRESPARLRVQTIDSLCQHFASMLPTAARFPDGARVREDAQELYRLAAERVHARLEAEPGPAALAVERVLEHFDNHAENVAGQVASMLGRRHQWLRGVEEMDPRLFRREAIEAGFARFTARKLQLLRGMFPSHLLHEALELAQYAASQLPAAPVQPAHVLAACDTPPGEEAASLPTWQALAGFLLTGSGTWRRKVDRRNGFPAWQKGDEMPKELRRARVDAMHALLAELASCEYADPLQQALSEVGWLVTGEFSDSDWQVVEAVIVLLFVAKEELQQVFQDRVEMDFPEILLAALRALGRPEAPGELALMLDHRLQHLLVDEFQDTSVTQVELLESLVTGWEPGDGRTLFLVGDPMQSIYRFREAEVGLFLHTQAGGIGPVSLDVLNLQRNFRSCAQVVEWLNRSFPRILPAADDPALGAVSYSEAEAAHGEAPAGGVTVHALIDDDGRAEALRVLEIIRAAQAARPEGSIGVLVSGRRHLDQIVPALRAAGIPYQAQKVDALATRQCVLDVLALTRALVHPADRIAWLAVLRAPWCGLSLADLLTVCGERADDLILDRLADAPVQSALSDDGRQRVMRILPTLRTAVDERLRRPLRAWVEGAWLAIGGAACLRDEAEVADVATCLEWLAGLPAGELPDPLELEAAISELYAQPDPAAARGVQLMTVHGAKGLEFDTVILPGLHRSTSGPDTPLLRWQELPPESGAVPDLLIAPQKAAGTDHQPHYRMLRKLDEERERNEKARLAYVGATRAQHALHLLGCVRMTEKKGERVLKAPQAGSLLGCFWPVVREQFESALDGAGQAPVVPPAAAEGPDLFRLPLDWCSPPPPAGLAHDIEAVADVPERPEFEWAGLGARHAGVVIHGLFEFADVLEVSGEEVERRVRVLLRLHGVPGAAQVEVLESAHRALANTRADEKGRWLFSSTHEAVETELPLTLCESGATQRCIIDRTFIDADGVRWIVDYKTGTHAGGRLDAFLDEEQARYREQLEAYARCFSHMEDRPCRLALYFPLVPAWREWEWVRPSAIIDPIS